MKSADTVATGGRRGRRSNSITGRPPTGSVTSTFLSIAILAGVCYAGYFVLRFGGLWTENDTTVFTRAAGQTLASGTAFSGQQYVHGFAYPGWLSAVSLLSGVSVSVLNTTVMPFIGAILLLVTALVLYSEILASPRWGLFATIVLLASPDVLFSALRGNHEKLNMAFMLMAIWVLIRGFKAMRQGNLLVYSIWVLLFYALTFGNAATNDYFASTLVIACTLTLGAAWIFARRQVTNDPAVARRMVFTVAVSWLLILWVMFFVFPPAGNDFALLHTGLDKLAALFLSLQPSSNPYVAAEGQWASPTVSFLLALFRYILFAGSFLVWAVQVSRVIRGKYQPSLEALLLLALYAGFGIIVAFNFGGDLTNLSFGTNLELRTFTYFALLAAPMLVWGIKAFDAHASQAGKEQTDNQARRNGFATMWRSAKGMHGPVGRAAAAVVLVAFVAVGLPKATLDPSVSNQWTFYTPAEFQAAHFFTQLPRAVSGPQLLWTGPDTRISNGMATRLPTRQSFDLFHGDAATPAHPVDWLASKAIVTSARLESVAMPNFALQDRVYDNGGAQIYHPQPRTSFQN